MGDYIVFGLTEWYSKEAKKLGIPISYVYKYNLKTKELSVVIKAKFRGINEKRDRIFCDGNEYISVNIDGLDERREYYNNRRGSFIKSKKRKGIIVKGTKSYRGGPFTYKYSKNKKGKRIVKIVHEKWKSDKNHIVLKTANKKNVILAKNAILEQEQFSDEVYYLKNCIVFFIANIANIIIDMML